MLQWLKRSLASFLGDKKDVVKNFPLIKKLNEKANIELDSKRSNLLKENFEEILNVVYSSDLKDYNIWLDFGTLLGYYRENDFISHDLDMDFGVQVSSFEEFEVIEKHLIDNGFNRTKEFYFNKNLVELDKELVKNLEAAGVKINEVNLPEFAKLVEPIYKNIGITEEFYKQLMDEMAKIRAEQK